MGKANMPSDEKQRAFSVSQKYLGIVAGTDRQQQFSSVRFVLFVPEPPASPNHTPPSLPLSPSPPPSQKL
ncbi:hypothetical protein M0802_007744 [Mischocyttarus mexicanus]|nr:hypothetical protein M0802_007744 [Mischocyttarus mexicanus]